MVNQSELEGSAVRSSSSVQVAVLRKGELPFGAGDGASNTFWRKINKPNVHSWLPQARPPSHHASLACRSPEVSPSGAAATQRYTESLLGARTGVVATGNAGCESEIETRDTGAHNIPAGASKFLPAETVHASLGGKYHGTDARHHEIQPSDAPRQKYAINAKIEDMHQSRGNGLRGIRADQDERGYCAEMALEPRGFVVTQARIGYSARKYSRCGHGRTLRTERGV
ncbi:hypothetical protein C8R44DRAFT_745641 [Mycena epipterygia]|nr:hypothetical protein C8R44DRAFT_745641 [Mycena epipterygia]